MYKLPIQAVGVMPTGTVAEFETDEWGIVTRPSITDRTRQIYTLPKEIDLGRPASNKQAPRITGVIDPSKARFNVTSVLIAGSTREPGA